MEQKRRFGRIPFGTTTYLELNGGRQAGSLVDISLKGALIQFQGQIEMTKGEPCTLVIPLSDEVVLRFDAELVHNTERKAGFKFTTIDADTFAHLVRLLELNLGDAAPVEQELRDLTKSE